MRCMDCGAELRRTTEPITEVYKGYSLTVCGIEHYVCDSCGEYEVDPDAANELSQALLAEYARARGLLAPHEIRSIRKRLGMTQAEFEELLGVSTPTVSRWETGAAAPSKSVCKLMQLYDSDPRLLKRKGGAPHEPEYKMAVIRGGVRWKVLEGGKPGVSGYAANHGATANKGQRFREMYEAKEG